MKKLIILSILFVLCLPFQASALGPMMLLSGSGGTVCPDWYADVIFGWSGDMVEGTNYAFDTSCTPLEGDNTTAPLTISKVGDGGSYAATIDAPNKYLTWAQTTDQYIDDDAPQTIWFKVWIDTGLGANARFFEAVYDNSNEIYMLIQSVSGGGTDDIMAAYIPGDAAMGNDPAVDSWINIAYSWDQGNANHSVYNDGAWEDDDGELSSGNMGANDIDDITLGENTFADNPDPTTYMYVDQFAIVGGYKTACPW